MYRQSLASALLLAAGVAGAQTYATPARVHAPAPVATPQGTVFSDQARVRSAQPQYETVQVPREECTSQWVTDPAVAAPNNGGFGASGYGGMIIGGVAGAVVGNQVGKGRGREAATAVGAVAGAVVGDRIAGSMNQAPVASAPPMQREVRSCRTVYEQQQRLVGYNVIYDYRGHEGSVVTQERPGTSLPIRVAVTPDIR
jgi:uncharacterized protein YcfJ